VRADHGRIVRKSGSEREGRNGDEHCLGCFHHCAADFRRRQSSLAVHGSSDRGMELGLDGTKLNRHRVPFEPLRIGRVATGTGIFESGHCRP
jgi:hypothetical protein